jgi:serine/threonine protein kinase/Tfp pilus assembly protein PilF
MIGQTVSHYRVLEKLGEGGMGVVYLAEDTHLGRRVAIKFPAGDAEEKSFRARFLREARSASTLSHQHIAAIYDYGETNGEGNGKGQPFIVMELVKGESLADLMDEGALTLKRAVEIIADVAEALVEAHAHGIIHRDIKPSNVHINERGVVKVLDFGLAKQLNDESIHATDSGAKTLPSTRTRSGVVIGTPLYLSPEQARGLEIDGRSDLFTLGTLLYECITGSHAFAGAGVLEIAGQVMHVDPPLPSMINARVTPELDRITMKALAKQVEARYQTAEEMLVDLRDALPTLIEEDAHRTQRLPAAKIKHESILTTISDTLSRPRLSLGILALILILGSVAVWGIMRLRRPLPYKPSAEAQKWYDTGAEALRDGSYYQASKEFEQAISHDEKFALAHARYAEALTELDYQDRAKDELLRVSTLAPDRAALEEVDALYLDAVTATLRRDFKAAIEAYGAIARLKPSEAQVYVDLGRAYENNEEPQKAIESYVKATTLDPQYATAFLRAGILYGRLQDLASANSSFDKAEQLYQSLVKVEGRAEVLFQRGVLLIRQGRVAEAREQLQKALELAQVINNQPQQIKAMLQLVYVLQHEGEAAEAEKLANDAVELAQANNMVTLTARGFIDLGNVFLSRGDFVQAEKYFRQGLDFAQRYKARRNEARAYLMLGSLRVQQGGADEAADFVEKALPFYRQGGYRTEVSQALILLGRINRLKGDYDAALKVYQQQLQLAEEANDQRQKALSFEGIGTVLAYQERYPEALSNFEQKYALGKSLSNQMDIAYGLIERGDMLWRMGRYADARPLLDEAFSLANGPDGGFKTLMPIIYESAAEMALSKRLFALSREKSQQALDLAGTQVDVAVEAKRALGLSLSFSGSTTHEGASACREALEMATRSKNPWLISRAKLALAEALLQANDFQEALTEALQAEDSFASAGQQASDWRAWLVAARASHSLHDAEYAHGYATKASAALSSLEQKWGTEVYNNYLARPDVEYYRKQLNEELNSLK